NPYINRRTVLFPLPLSPTIAVIFPSPISKDRSLTAITATLPGNERLTCSPWIRESPSRRTSFGTEQAGGFVEVNAIKKPSRPTETAQKYEKTQTALVKRTASAQK